MICGEPHARFFTLGTNGLCARTESFQAKILPYNDGYMCKIRPTNRVMGFVEIEPHPVAKMDGNDFPRQMIYMKLILIWPDIRKQVTGWN